MLRQPQHVDLLGLREVAVRVCEDIQLAAARLDFLEVGLELVEQAVVGGDGDDGHVAVDQGERAVLEFAGGVGFGVDVGDFLELECAFERDWPMPASAEEEGVAAMGDALRPGLDAGLEFQPTGDGDGQVAQAGQVVAFGLFVDAAAQLADDQGQQEQRRELGGEGLGGGDADFRPGAGDEAQRTFAHDGRFRHVADGQRAGVAELLGVAQRGQGVGSFAGLRDGDDELIGVGHRAAVAVFAGDLDHTGDAGERFKPVARGDAGVVTRPAGQDQHRANAAE